MQENRCDVFIIGAGPAGLSAAIYCSRAGLSTLVFGSPEKSNIARAHAVENYFGVAETLSGKALLENGKAQAQRFGTRFLNSDAVDIKKNEDGAFVIKDSLAQPYVSRSVIICSGMGFKKSGIENERKLTGKGVSFCAACDGFFFKNKSVVIVGGSNFATEEAIHLAAHAAKVAILSHGKDFSIGKEMEKLIAKNKIKLMKSPVIKSFEGEDNLQRLIFADGSEMACDGAFLALGNATASDFANRLGLARAGAGNAFIVADPRTGETNVKGVYAAGDCTGGNAQVAKSVGEGCNAAVSVIKFIKGVKAYADYA
ncbi:FAD-dependent oxidoreductase [Candidatus Peregrinibacteria bacterium]|nr:FAD-dependent oxidoreductase [Candidatus Peregrinibacteria bacterium]